MVYFQTKNPNLGIFLRHWNGKGWYILWPIVIFRAILLFNGHYVGDF
jgi:hypothetical protein